MTEKIMVLVVEDSVVVREMLTHIISTDARLTVVAAVGSGEEAMRALDRYSPHVISLDIRLPGMDGFQTTQQIMSTNPTPIVVISNDVDDHSLNISMNALRAGALAVLEKPPGFASRDYETASRRICDQLVAMSSVKVVRQRFSRDLNLASASTKPIEKKPETHFVSAVSRQRQFQMLGLVASTGGPNALLQVLQTLPKNFPLPIAIVQHITESFLESFAGWLGQESPFRTHVVREATVAQPGVIYLAAPGYHLIHRDGAFQLSQTEPVSMQKPSGTVLLQSLAREFGSAAIGVVLTGMGDDGAQGLLEMRKAGAFTIAEHRSTTVVYGMPACAEQIGAACEMIPVQQIGQRLCELTMLAPGSERNAV